MTKELKPCPFCGGEADVSDEGIGTEPERYWACCLNSGCFVEGTGAYATEQEAIDAWNTRHKRKCNLKEARALVNPDICGDGWDADARRDSIIRKVAELCGAEVVDGD